MKHLWIKIKDPIARIGLVDQFLILFMLILLLYTAISLFTGATDSQNGDMVDTIIRTSAASIFGYFISSNFAKANTKNAATDASGDHPELPEQADDEDRSVQPDGQTASASPAEEPTQGSVPAPPSDPTACGKLQVIIVSAIGGCALLLLFTAKFFIPEPAEISATLSQLRDFVSACIGFLVSCGRVK